MRRRGGMKSVETERRGGRVGTRLYIYVRLRPGYCIKVYQPKAKHSGEEDVLCFRPETVAASDLVSRSRLAAEAMMQLALA